MERSSLKKVGMIFLQGEKITIEYEANAITVGQGEFRRCLEALWKGQFKT